MKERRQTDSMKAVLRKTDRCELCGSWRDLQAHHIIPISLGGPDVEDNLIVICGGCHARLTPKGLLTSMGIERVRRPPFEDLRLMYYQDIEDESDGYTLRLTMKEMLDIFDSVIDRFNRKYKCTFRKRQEDDGK